MLLSAVRDVTGPSLSPVELEAAARGVYKLFGKLAVDPSPSNKLLLKDRLREKLGTVPDATVDKLQQLCDSLREFRGPDAFIKASGAKGDSAERKSDDADDDAAAAAAAAVVGPLAALGAGAAEFGHDLTYTPPSVLPPARLQPLVPHNPPSLPNLGPSGAPPAFADVPVTVPELKDASWLVQACQQFLALSELQGFDGESMSVAVWRALKTSGGDAAVQSAVADVVGFSHNASGSFDFMQLLVENRRELVRIREEEIHAAARGPSSRASAPSSGVGFHSRGFSVTTTSQQRAEKERRKQARRRGGPAVAGAGAGAGTAAFVPGRSSKLPSGPRPKYELPVGEGGGFLRGAKRLLPRGTKTTNEPGLRKVGVLACVLLCGCLCACLSFFPSGLLPEYRSCLARSLCPSNSPCARGSTTTRSLSRHRLSTKKRKPSWTVCPSAAWNPSPKKCSKASSH